MYANQVVAQTSPLKDEHCSSKEKPPSSPVARAKLLRLIQQVWHPYTLKPQRDGSLFVFFFLTSSDLKIGDKKSHSVFWPWQESLQVTLHQNKMLFPNDKK